MKSRIMESIKTGSFDDNVTVLIFNKDELNCKAPAIDRIDENEFRYEGRYYDIVKEELRGSKVYFYCIHDEEESFLNFLFVKHYEKNNQNNTSQKLLSGSMFKFLPDYLLSEKSYQPDNYQLNTVQVLSEICHPLNFPDILTPPPQITKTINS